MKTRALLLALAALLLLTSSASGAAPPLPFKPGTYKGTTKNCGNPTTSHPCYPLAFRAAVHPQCRVGRDYKRALCFSKLTAKPDIDMRCADGSYIKGFINSIFKALPRSGIFSEKFGNPGDREEFYVKLTGSIARGYVRKTTSFSRFGGPEETCDSGRVSFTAKRV
ncbi:MAG: hypothetical protein QOI91_2885 [Solirubrobacteraceae bacterium]|jgi:hypothetical protein|nr:hypothetical protein [Solirubrobacteraceae bacterium]